jgi:hypothetical protein
VPVATRETIMVLTETFEDALIYATRLHARQLRKGSRTPYVGHLLGVAALVIEDGGDEAEAIAALLHDAGEDQGGRAQVDAIGRRYGARVAGIVEACSDTLSPDKEPWRERKERLLATLESADGSAIRVALADKLYNLRAILTGYHEVGETLWDRFNADADHVWYYGRLIELFRRRSSSPMVQELERDLEELRRLVTAAPHPIPDSYWVRPGQFLAGEYPGAQDSGAARRKLRRLGWSGVDLFLDLTERAEKDLVPYAPWLPEGGQHRRVPIADATAPDAGTMEAILDTIDGAIAGGRTVYLHCFGGIGRTGTVVGCWMVRHGATPDEALRRIAALRQGTPDAWRRSPETPDQEEMVRSWSAVAPRARERRGWTR